MRISCGTNHFQFLDGTEYNVCLKARLADHGAMGSPWGPDHHESQRHESFELKAAVNYGSEGSQTFRSSAGSHYMKERMTSG